MMNKCICGSVWWRFEENQDVLATNKNGNDARFGRLNEKLKAFCSECKRKYWYDPDTRQVTQRQV